MKCRLDKTMIVKAVRVLLAATFMFAGTAFAGPPLRPMVISGELLIDGAPVAAGTELKLQVAQTVITMKAQQSEAGLSYYRLVLPQAGAGMSHFRISFPHIDLPKFDTPGFREGDTVTFLQLGEKSLTDAPRALKPGVTVKNVLVGTAVQEAPTIVDALAAQSVEVEKSLALEVKTTWILNAKIKPIPRAPKDPPLSYRIQWFERKDTVAATDDSGEQKKSPTVKVAEETLASVSEEKTSTLTYTRKGIDHITFDLYVTPLTGDGKYGPSVRQTVIPVLTEGGI